jgi:hypothetical protein
VGTVFESGTLGVGWLYSLAGAIGVESTAAGADEVGTVSTTGGTVG